MSHAAGAINGATPVAVAGAGPRLERSTWLSPPENEGIAGKTAIVTRAGHDHLNGPVRLQPRTSRRLASGAPDRASNFTSLTLLYRS